VTPNLPKLAIVLVALCALPGHAQQRNAPAAGNKKLYCWDQNGQRVCADALPAEAMQNAREEISMRSGMRTGQVQRALTDEERAGQAEEEARRRTEALAEETRRRTDQAILTLFQDEDELKRVFTERVTLVDNSIGTARYNVASLRDGLVVLLRTAGERELSGKPVPDKLADDIRQRHQQLLYHKYLQRSFEQQRVALTQEIDETLQRYRELRGADQPGARGAVFQPGG